jgi:hypothetical protein
MLGLYAAFNLNAVVAVVGLVNVLIVLVTKAYPCFTANQALCMAEK